MDKNPASTILIIDDEQVMREAMQDLLADEGYHIVTAENGAKGLAKASELAPDLILLDVRMPEMDGFEVCQRLRADPLLAEVPIIMVTSLTDRSSRLRGFEVGADDFVSKPFDELELVTRVHSITRLNRYRRLLLEQTRRHHAERALEVSEARYRKLFDRVPVGLYRVTPGGKILDANPTLVEMLNYPNWDVLLATNATDIYADIEEHSKWQEMMEHEETVRGFETQWRRHDGTVIWTRNTARIVRDTEGQVLYYEGAVEDITERKQAEQALQRSLEKTARGQRLLLALNQAAQAVQRARTTDEVYQTIGEEIARLGYHATLFTLTEDRKHLAAGYLTFESAVLRAAEKLTGLSARDYHFPLKPGSFYQRILVDREAIFTDPGAGPIAEALPKPVRPLADKLADLLGVHRAIYIPLEVGGETHGLMTVMGADLTEDDMPAMTAFASQAAIAIGNAQLYQEAQQEIAERKRAEETAHKERDRAQRYLDVAGVMLVAIDKKGEITLINRRGGEILGYKNEKGLLGKNWFDTCLPTEIRKTVKAVFDQLMTGEIEPVEYHENPTLTRSGEERLIAWYNTVLRDESGNIVGTLSSGEDITKRKQAEEALRENEEMHRTLFETMTQGVLYWDVEGKVVSANPAAERILGLTLGQIQGKAPIDPRWKVIRQDGSEIRAETSPAIAVLRSGEKMHNVVMGFFNPVLEGHRWVNVNVIPLCRPGESKPYRVHTIFEDITERVQAEAEIKQRNRELAALNEIGQAITSTLDLREMLTIITDHTTRLMGMAAASVILYDQASDGLYFAAASGEGADFIVGQRLALGQGIAGWVAQHGEPLLVPDVSQEPRWFEEFDERSHFATRSILCVPLRSKGHTIGALEAINKEHGFNQDDLNLLSALTAQIATAIDNAQLFEEVRAGREQLHALSRRLVEVQEAERTHIARELHDETGQALSSLLLSLSLLEQRPDCSPEVKERIVQMEALIDEMLENLHRLAMNLRPATLDHLGLAVALEQYIETFGEQYTIDARFEAIGLAGERLPPEMETALYRIVQEALTNVLRHAQASRVDVLVERRGGLVVTIVEDDGVGFDLEEAKQSGRLGLFGMQERAEILGGALVIESAARAGTTVFVEVPCQLDED